LLLILVIIVTHHHQCFIVWKIRYAADLLLSLFTKYCFVIILLTSDVQADETARKAVVSSGSSSSSSLSVRYVVLVFRFITSSRLFFTARRICIARTILSQDVRLSVCLSHAGIESKWLHISSKFFHCRVAPPFQFFHTKWDGDIPMGTPLMGAPNARGYEKITIFDQCLALSGK